MNKIDFSKYHRFSDLPLEDFQQVKAFSVYILDKNWNYLFVNEFVSLNLGGRGMGLTGANMWQTFPELANDADFMVLKRNSENGIRTNLTLISPINSRRLHIIGVPLDDCYLFYSSILPDREQLLRELREEIRRVSPAG